MDKVDELVKAFLAKGRKLIHGNPSTCLVGAINASEPGDPAKEGFYKRAARILGVDERTVEALEAGYEGWGGKTTKISHPEAWETGAKYR